MQAIKGQKSNFYQAKIGDKFYNNFESAKK